MKKRRTWRWVTRDNENDGDHDFLHIWESLAEPVDYGEEGGFCPVADDCDNSVVVCAVEFKDLFGFVPRPGQCLKVEFSAKVVK